MIVFLDTNILIDFLSQRQPAAMDALKIFNAKDKGYCTICMSSLTIVNAIYILTSTYKLKSVLEAVEQLIVDIDLIPTSKAAIMKSLASGFLDFEDAVQYFSALEHGNIDYILTRDKKGFAQSTIPVLMPSQFIAEHLSSQ